MIEKLKFVFQLSDSNVNQFRVSSHFWGEVASKSGMAVVFVHRHLLLSGE